MVRYFYPDGSLIEQGKDEGKTNFINFYSQVYYFMNKNTALEKRIEKILADIKDGVRINQSMMADFLEWKVDKHYFYLNKGDNVDTVGALDKRVIELDELFEVAKNIDINIPEGSVSKYLGKLIQFKGIGVVYAIAILYFCTGGTFPIYDRFAHIALMTITQEKDFNTIVTEEERRRQFHFNSSNVEVIAKDYVSYSKMLKEWLGEMTYNRKVDQALWAYGHLFSENKTNMERCGINL